MLSVVTMHQEVATNPRGHMTIDRTVVETTVSRRCAADDGQLAVWRGRPGYLTVIGVNGLTGIDQVFYSGVVIAHG